MIDDTTHLFDETFELPDPDARRRLGTLVGLDTIRDLLVKEARLLLHPKDLVDWSKKHHGANLPILSHFLNRPPLFLFAGDVGTGKTTLAETFGDTVAREEGLSVTVYRLSLNARGSGAVGEMTRLLSAAFKEVRNVGRKGTSVDEGPPTSAAILLIDEADALAQSRELAQMHHEDRAGVNALIRGVDDLANEALPVLVVMCTNRAEALDPAVKRRAAQIFEFSRPTEEQRIVVLRHGLEGAGFTDEQILDLARLTGSSGGSRSYGHTYSDLVRRFLPAIVLDAFPERPIEFERARILALEIKATPPFGSETLA